MPINQDLLIASPTFQEALVDKNGTPMANGTITCYRDNSRTTLKNWYYQSGTPGNYSYIALPNPLTLSPAGTVCDVNGVDTIPFFYPYNEQDETFEPYYITIINQAQTNVITRSYFPFVANQNDGTTDGLNLENLIINNVFWRNIQPNYLNVTPYTSVNLQNVTSRVVAPSQHDGFSMPDITFIKNNTSGQDALTFTPFPLSSDPILENDITPEYYINHTCSNMGTGETQKCYQLPISLHINTLASVPYTVTIQAQNTGGTSTGQNVISLYILQYTGTGSSSPNPYLIKQFTLTPQWDKYSFTAVFPPTTGLTLGGGADDALYLQVQMPLNTPCSINFTKPSIYLTNDVTPSNNFQTYDQIDTIINSPRTGDIRTSLNTFYPYGWVPLNDGSIGNAASVASTRKNADTWPLFNLIWNSFSSFTSGTTNILAQMFDGAGLPVAYGASAIADFNANKSISLTKLMGKVLLGTVPVAALSTSYSTTFTCPSPSTLLLANNTSFFNGQPAYLTGGSLPAGLTANTIYYVTQFNGTNGCSLATTFTNAIQGTAIVFGAGGSGTIVAQISGSYEGEYAHTQQASEVGAHSHTASVALTNNTFLFGAGGTNFIQAGGSTAVTVNNNSPAGTPFNVTQPGTFYNMFMKL